MIKEKIVYVTKDGKNFNTMSAAEKHQRLCNFREDLETLVYGKDLFSQDRNTVLDFVEENIEELKSIFFKLNDENVCTGKLEEI